MLPMPRLAMSLPPSSRPCAHHCCSHACLPFTCHLLLPPLAPWLAAVPFDQVNSHCINLPISQMDCFLPG